MLPQIFRGGSQGCSFGVARLSDVWGAGDCRFRGIRACKWAVPRNACTCVAAISVLSITPKIVVDIDPAWGMHQVCTNFKLLIIKTIGISKFG
jgi:hypothetical protein